jgi:hypothetical protein
MLGDRPSKFLEVRMLSARCTGRMVVLLAVAILLPQFSFASEPTLFLAGVEMKLGMPEVSLIANLQENYKLTKVGEDGWVIFEKQGPPYKTVGNIGFTKGKLSWISKDWGSYHSDEALDFAKELFSLLSSLADNHPTPALVHPKVKVRRPGLVMSEIELLYPDKTISISIVESKEDGNSISISEVLKIE